jgi:hypothetical protein
MLVTNESVYVCPLLNIVLKPTPSKNELATNKESEVNLTTSTGVMGK